MMLSAHVPQLIPIPRWPVLPMVHDPSASLAACRTRRATQAAFGRGSPRTGTQTAPPRAPKACDGPRPNQSTAGHGLRRTLVACLSRAAFYEAGLRRRGHKVRRRDVRRSGLLRMCVCISLSAGEFWYEKYFGCCPRCVLQLPGDQPARWMDGWISAGVLALLRLSRNSLRASTNPTQGGGHATDSLPRCDIRVQDSSPSSRGHERLRYSLSPRASVPSCR